MTRLVRLLLLAPLLQLGWFQQAAMRSILLIRPTQTCCIGIVCSDELRLRLGGYDTDRRQAPPPARGLEVFAGRGLYLGWSRVADYMNAFYSDVDGPFP